MASGPRAAAAGRQQCPHHPYEPEVHRAGRLEPAARREVSPDRRRRRPARRRGARPRGGEAGSEAARLPGTFNSPEDFIVVENVHPAIVDAELFGKVQARLKARFRKHTTPVSGGGDWLLSGLLFCGECGGIMYGATTKHRRAGSTSTPDTSAARRTSWGGGTATETPLSKQASSRPWPSSSARRLRPPRISSVSGSKSTRCTGPASVTLRPGGRSFGAGSTNWTARSARRRGTWRWPSRLPRSRGWRAKSPSGRGTRSPPRGRAGLAGTRRQRRSAGDARRA